MSQALLRRPFGMYMWLVRLAAKNNNSGFAPVLSCRQSSLFKSLRATLGVRSERDGHPR
jgi:hypothetical protein